MLDITNKALFEPHLNTHFTITVQGGGSIETELIKIESWDREVTEGFSLVFKGPKEPVVRHSTLQIEHPQLGQFEMYLGPVSTLEPNGTLYQAVVNKLKTN